MPDASLTIDGTTVISKTSGNITYDSGTFNGTIGGTIGASATFPAGHILQMKYVQYTNTVEINNQSYVDIGTESNGLIIPAFTPIRDNSKLVIQFKVEIGGGGGTENGGNLGIHINDVIVDPPIPTGYSFSAHAGTDSNQNSSYGGGVGTYNTNSSVGMTYYNVTSLTPIKISVKAIFRTDINSESFWINRAYSTSSGINTVYVSNMLVWEIAQ